jgi:hypothetical protein
MILNEYRERTIRFGASTRGREYLEQFIDHQTQPAPTVFSNTHFGRFHAYSGQRLMGPVRGRRGRIPILYYTPCGSLYASRG